jgi:hypothetical protein
MRQETERKTYSTQDARGADIVLRTRSHRIIFIAGLAAAVAFGVIIALLAAWARPT